MARVLLFHHAQGLTEGMRAFADDLRAAGHDVDTPDLFGGRTFPTVEAGVAHADRIGFERIAEQGAAMADGLPSELVYAGFSLGVLPAQRLAQQRPGARGALLYHGAIPLGWFGDRWPAEVPLQLHVMEDDELGDVEEARALATVTGGELYLYPGHEHLFVDRSLAAHDPAAAQLVLERSLDLLARVT
jgi:dienelactone hydrolase